MAAPDVLLVDRTSFTTRVASVERPVREGWLLVFMVSGRRTYRFRGATVDASAGTLLVLGEIEQLPQPPFVEPWECLYARFEPSPGWSPPPSFERVAPGAYRAHISLSSTRRRVEDAFGRMNADLRTRSASHAIDNLEITDDRSRPTEPLRRELLLMALREIFVLVDEKPQVRKQLDPRIRDALELLGSDLQVSRTVRSLSAACGLSPSRFAHLFRAEVGISPVRALRQMRLHEAALQLRYGDRTVEAIAEAAGFTSPSHLSREFKRHYGMSPRAYRSQTDEQS